MLDFILRRIRLNRHQDTDTLLQSAGNIHFLHARHRDVLPPGKAADRFCRKYGMDIRRGG